MQKVRILVIIPAYNEEESIGKTIQELRKTLLEREEFEIDFVIVNDCSSDRTREILRGQGVDYIDLPINLGIGGGMQTGYKLARDNGYDIAIQMDGDGQHIPRFLWNLIEPIIEKRANMVIGSRFLTKEGFQSSGSRRVGIGILSSLIFLCSGCLIKDVTSGFRAVDRKGIELFVRDYAQDYPEPEAIITLSLLGLKIVEVPVLMREREGGVSSISGLKSVYYMIKVSMAILLKRTFVRKGGV